MCAVRRSRADIVHDLEAQGLRFRTFSIVHESEHALADWDWNQRDLLHVPFVHGGFRLTHATVDADVASVVYLQRVLGLRVPVAATFFHPDPARPLRIYTATLGPFALVVEADLERTPTGTRVETTYSVGAPGISRALLPLAERFLRMNYARIDREDHALRSRRRELRQWGYGFVEDHGSYSRSLDLGVRNVAAPPHAESAMRVQLGRGPRDVFVGRSDHLGLRVIVRPDGSACVYPRMCMHEGASLDACEERRGTLRCPWHGRTIAPLATFDTRDSTRVRETSHHRLELVGDELSITARVG